MQTRWYRSKKVWGTILACLTLAVGTREGWNPEITRDIALCFMSGVTIEGVIDSLALFQRRQD